MKRCCLEILFCTLILCIPTGCSPASNERDWRPEYAKAPHMTVDPADPDLLHIRDIRNFHYRQETDFDIDYIDADFRPSDLTKLEYAVVYWDGHKAIAHSMLVFSFRNGSSLVFSVETRKDKTDGNGIAAGLFRQYELICIIGTETDLLKLRTNHRHENVYLYRTNATFEQMKIIFLDLLDRVNRLYKTPTYYNTLSMNCTKSLLPSIRKAIDIPIHHKEYLLNGFSDKYAYQLGFLTQKTPDETFEQMKKRCYINPLANQPGDPADYSVRIRKNEAAPSLQ